MKVGTSLVLALGFLALGLPATPAAAVQATGGAARFPSIEWFSWGAEGSAISNGGVTRTERYTLAGQSFDITCTLSNIARTAGNGPGNYLESYRSGTWQGDGFDQLYNIGGVDDANTMFVGLSNRNQGNTITLDFSCSATLAGEPFPLAGLVMADAEASGGSEYVGATIPTSATWRILDRVRGSGCTLDTYARRTVVGTANRLELYGPENNTCETGTGSARPGPSAVAFMDGATSATKVTIAGSGKSAIALGVAYNTDFGDAPESYGDSGAALQYAYSGGEVPLTSSALTLAQYRGTPVFGSIALATNVQPSPRLGTTVDPEATQAHTPDAAGDDTAGEPASGGPDDENGLTLANPMEVAPGGTAVIGPVTCVGTGYIAGWIDWNLNGAFDTGERSSTTPACPTGGSVNLSFAVPSTILGSGGTLNTFLRVRLAPTTTQLNPTGLSTGGEVEDYRLVAGAKPRVILRKTTLGGSGGPYGFTLTNTAQGSGTVTTTNAGSATQVDGDPATTGNQAFLVSQTGTAVGISESTIPAGWALSSVTCTSGAQNVGSLSGTTLTLPAAAIVPGAVITCDFRNGRPSVSLAKTAGTLSGATAGSTLPYTFTVTNTGQTPLTAVTITDPKVASVSCVATSLAIGAATTCTGTHTLTQAEVDAGTVVNSATASASPPSGPVVTSTAGTTSTVPRTPAISLTKTAGTPTGSTAGSTVTYSFVVTNSGNVTLTGVGVTDPTIGAVSCPATTLPPGAATSCSKTYSLTQADVDAGVVNNTATAAGTPPSGAAVTATATANRSLTRTATITLDKQAGSPTGNSIGSSISYDFVVTNTGNVTLTALGVLDAKTGPVSCPVSTLLPGATTTCTGVHVLTQADVDAGRVDNTATATANAPGGLTSPTASDTATVPIARTATIAVDKQFGGFTDLDANGQDAGDRLSYTFLVTNTGNVTLAAVGVADPKIVGVSCPVATLVPGAATSCSGSYLLTQADVDAGHVANTATATGTPPAGLTSPTAIDSTDTPVTAGPAISLDKTAGTPSGNTVGATIHYSFVVTNSGNVTLTAVGVTDAKVGPVSCPSTSLAPGASTTCTKAYTLTQDDVDSGSVVNTATANGTSPANVTVSATDSATSTISRSATLSMDKQAATPSGNTAGSTIAYAFVVTNTGNVNLAGLTINDPDVTGLTCPVTTLAPGATTTCTATHVLTQGDVDSGHVANTATATGNPPTGVAAPSATDSTDTALAQAAAITLDKQAATPSGNTAGSTVDYSFVITNTGNVTLTSVGVADPMVGTVTCPVTTLAPGAATTCVATYPVTQADVDAGALHNTATATGTPPGTMAEPTATDSTTTTLDRTAALSLDKQAGTPSDDVAGASIAYDFVVTNTGNVTLTALGLLDPTTGPVSCPVATLLPGATTTCTATYVLTQADLDAGVVDNTATATATAPAGLTSPTATDTATSTLARTATLTLDKQAGAAGTAVGSPISYDFVVTNTGNVTLTALSVADANTGPVSCPMDTLAPAASTTCTASHVLTQVDIDPGAVHNTATATAAAPAGLASPTATDTTTVTIARTAAITLDKQAGSPSGTTAGSTITYSFTVLNSGNVTLTGVGVTDPKAGAVACLAADLAPGVSTTCSATYELTQADVDGGHVPNTATATGTPPAGLTAPTATDSTDTALTSDPAMTLEKHSGAPTGNTAGSTVAYTFLVSNTGNVTLDSVAVTDAKVGTVTCPTTTLAPGDSTTCTASYTLTQGDVDAGRVENTATAAGTPPTGDQLSVTDTVTTPVAASPAITLDKSAGMPSGASAGSTIDYSFLVGNTGNVTLTAVGITDPKLGAVTCLATTLAPGASTTCAATYELTQADVDSGHVANTATAGGTPPGGDPVTAEDSTDTTIAAGPAITLDKTAGTPSGYTAGSTIAYGFAVRNTGNVTLTSVAVTDPKVGTVTCLDTTLAPGGSTTCSATYELTQSDVDSGTVENTASVTGDPPTGDPVTGTDTTTTPIPAAPAITLDKTAGPPSGSIVGSSIDFGFLITNSGNVTLSSIAITDLKVGAVTCPDTTLAPGASTTCAASYHLTQADVDAGHVANTASVAGNPPSGDPVTAADGTDTTITPGPSITLEKTSGTPSGNTAGSTIAYTFTVMNTGNVTLTAVGLTDPKVPDVSCPSTVLTSGASTTCTATYQLTQADVDAGTVVNTASVVGNPPTGDPVTDTDSTTTTIPATPAIALDKSAGLPSGATAGSTIDYGFAVGNTGNVTLTAVTITDPKVGAVSCLATSLAPGVSTTCSATHLLTQTEVDAGHVANTATASGTPPTGDPVTADDSTDTTITPGPAITLEKTAGTPSGNTAGSTVPYSFLVGNTGNVTLTSIEVADSLAAAVTCPDASLAPAATMTCTATYSLTQADVDAGTVVNTASVSGNPPTGDRVTATDTATTTIPAGPAIALDKQAGTPSGAIAGATIAYTFVVANTGNVTLTSVAVTDLKVGTVDCLDTTLAPGATTTCSATYLLSQADVDSGHVTNTASTAGNPPSGDPVTASDTTDTSITSGPRITLDKTAGVPSGATAGSTLDYSFLVTNTGNVTLTSVAVTDTMAGTVTCPDTTLAPGASTTCAATYALTQADVDAGTVVNTAAVAGDPPTGDPVTSTDSVTTTIPASPVITLDKTAGTPTGTAAGDTIDYTFVVTNAGNVTLGSVGIIDAKVGPVSCIDTTLAPGASTTCAATYVLSQADVDAGHVANTASVAGNPPAGDPVTAADSTDTTITPGPALTLDKTAGTPSGNTAGSSIDYSFLVTNTGNVTLTSVGVDDPMVGTVTCADNTLAPAGSTTCTGTYVLTQAGVDAGTVVNTATAAGNPPAGDPVSGTDTVTTTIPASPSITLDKTAGTPSGNTAGSTIDYGFLVTNTGNVTLTSVAVTDPMVGTVTCPDTTLAPAASTTCAATYLLTQTDVDAGTVANTASVAGNPPAGDPVTGTDSTTTTIPASPAISLDKTAGTPSGNSAGDTIDYSFLVTNTGNVTLTSVSVTDPMVGTVTCPDATLAPGTSTTCAATYVLTQTDVDAGTVANTASVAGNPPAGDPVTSTDSVTSPIPAAPAIALDKTAGALVDATGNGDSAGDTVPYTFLVTNTGNVTLSTIEIADASVGAVTCPDTTLAPATSTLCTADYVLTQADVDAGTVHNTASVTANPPTGTAVTSSDAVDVAITAKATLLLDKQAGTPTGGTAGATIAYDFVVTNTGNLTIEAVVIDDPLLGSVTCPAGPLAPGATITCEPVVYSLTQADVDAGHVANTASAVGMANGDPTPESVDSTDTPISAGPAITLDKTAGTPSGNTAGSSIDYSFLVTNTGNVTLTSVVVTDALVGSVTCPDTTLAPGASTTCTGTYTLTQVDVDAGTVVNTATAAGNPPAGDPVTGTDSTTTTIPASPAISLDKTAGTPSGNTTGSSIDYSFLVTNTGNVTLTSVGVDDPMVGTVTCPDNTLAPAGSTTCTGTYVLTQVDVDAGTVVNTAMAAGNPPAGDPVSGTDSVTTSIPASPAITLDKTAGIPSGNTAGDTIDYSLLVTNTGNVTLTSVAVTDALVGTVTCPDNTLAPGASSTCSATYVLTQADVDAGTVVNTASVAGTPPTGDPVTGTDSVTTMIPAGPGIALDKQAGIPSGATVGSLIGYSFVVTNAGNVTLSAVGITDLKLGAVTCADTVLAPAGTTTCAGSYALTQADVDAGHVANTASVAGTPPAGDPVTAVDSTDTTISASPAITLDKAAGTPSGNTAGSSIDYSFLVTNTGNVTLTSVGVDDPMVGTVTCADNTLAPAGSTTCTGTYILTQVDVDAGTVVNTATAAGTPPAGDPVTGTDSTTTTIPASPSITMDKQAGIPSGFTAGASLAYSFLVANTGNVTLASVAIDDPKAGTVDCPDTTLAPGTSTTCTATYLLTQADVDAGHVANTAEASGDPQTGEPVTAGDFTDTPIPSGPAIALDKQAGSPAANTVGAAIDYTFVVTNAGNVTLTAVGVDDPKVGAVACPATTLAPGAAMTCAATYLLTQPDVDAGIVHNDATATGTPPTGDPVTAGDTTSTTVPAEPSLTLAKLAGAATGNRAGDTIGYTFVVTNSGNVTLDAIDVTDAKVGTVTCPVTQLAPSGSTTCTATYTLTQADVDAGEVNNTAGVTGNPPTGDPVTATDTVTSPILAGPGIDLAKTGTADGDRAGDAIHYEFLVTNTGNVTLSAVGVIDAKTGTVACPVDTLAPAGSTTCTATYLLTQADVDAGAVHNEATATGTPPIGEPVTAPDSVDTPIAPGPAVTIDKQAGAPSAAQAGGIIGYTFVVTNTGNVTLSALNVDDPTAGPVGCPETTLAPGQSTTCSATYALSQADLDSGEVVNNATVTGTPPTGQVVTDSDSVTTPLAQVASLSLDKTADVVEEAQEGDLINFSFVATNTGNVTLTSVVVSDPMLAAVTCPTTTLAPGESMTCTGSPYTITKRDVELGGLINSATVSSAFCPVTGCVQVQAGDSVTVATAIVDPEHEGGGNGHGGNGGGLAYTGVAGAPELIGLGGGILAAGLLLLLFARRREA